MSTPQIPIFWENMLKWWETVREKANTKYTQLASIIILMGVAIVVVGFSDVILVILPCDVAMLLAVFAFEQRTRTLMKRKESKPLIQFESPLNWLKNCALFSFVSIIAGLGYETMNIVGIESNAPIVGNWSLLFFAIAFFVIGLIYILRITVFMIDPASKTNIFAGKLIYMVLEVGMRVILLSFVVILQFFNGSIFSLIIKGTVLQNIFPTPIAILYASTIVLSFIAMVPLTYTIMFRLRQQVKRWGWVVMASFFSPWFILIIASALLSIGIKLG
jgi:hypothetical protein